jgi:hypothetical protein
VTIGSERTDDDFGGKMRRSVAVRGAGGVDEALDLI